ASRDLVRSLARGLEESLDRLLCSFDRVSHGGRRRAPHLELGDHAIDSFDVRLDGSAVVAADRGRETNVEEVLRDVELKIGEAVLLSAFRSAWRRLLRLVCPRRLVGHVFEYATPATPSHHSKSRCGECPSVPSSSSRTSPFAI